MPVRWLRATIPGRAPAGVLRTAGPAPGRTVESTRLWTPHIAYSNLEPTLENGSDTFGGDLNPNTRWQTEFLEPQSSVPIKCPNCRERLATESYRPVGGASCFYCHGVWLPGEVMDSALTGALGSPDRATLLAKASDGGPARASLICPACDTAAFVAIKIKGVELDLCRQCGGMYFDRGEVERVFPRLKEILAEDSDSVGEAVASDIADEIVALVVLWLSPPC